MSSETRTIKVLLIEDDEDDYIVARHLLTTIYGGDLLLEWVRTFEEGLEAIAHSDHDVCLLDYRLGEHNGLEILSRAREKRYAPPIVMLSGQSDLTVDLEATRAGAADYLVKGQINASMLERTIRYAIAHRRNEEERIQLIHEQEARKQAEEANRLKDEFLSTVSHELRTPLTAILNWVNLLQSDDLDAEMIASGLATIERNATAQARLIDDLLDISRITNGKMRINVRPIVLAPIVRDVIETMRPAAIAKNIELQVAFNGGVKIILGDSDRLQQVFWNLLTNAIKFTPSGGRIMVTVNRTESVMEVIVSDTGIGISPEFLPYVFERFRQAARTNVQVSGGLGLGLSIVHHLVELHGGSIQAESDGIGQGARFTVRLPIPQPAVLASVELSHAEEAESDMDGEQ
jgi:signal transduction histidine kinase